MRLDKYIAACGCASRREIKKLIKQRLVSVDGDFNVSPNMSVTDSSHVEVKGQELVYREFIYLMLNKPAGYVSAAEDKKYSFVTQLIPEEYVHFNAFPIGRLDIDTEGLLLLTNDGQLAHNLTSPKKNIYKKYFAILDKPAEQADIEVFKKGMEFKDFTAKPAVLEITENPHEVYIQISEGKFHQVKRMCERVGKTVTYLKRVSIGRLELDTTLDLGEIRELTEEELSLLKN